MACPYAFGSGGDHRDTRGCAITSRQSATYCSAMRSLVNSRSASSRARSPRRRRSPG